MNNDVYGHDAHLKSASAVLYTAQDSSDKKTIFMRREDWEKWDAALRSGKYIQGKSWLFSKDEGGKFSYCCLGVLQMALDGKCEASYLANNRGLMYPSPMWAKKHEVYFRTRDEYCTYNAPFLPSLDEYADRVNDCGRYDFIQIADAIKDCVAFTDSTPLS